MSSRRTISEETKTQLDESPMDMLMAPAAQKSKAKSKTVQRQEVAASERQVSIARERMTVQINQDIIERVKDAVYWTPGLTVAQFTEEALEAALVKLEKHNGKPFQKRKAQLKPGRPLSMS